MLTPPAKIIVCALDNMENIVNEVSASHLVSLINHQMMPDTPSLLEQENHLKLPMNDIEGPVTGSVSPSLRHIEKLVSFIRKWDQTQPMVIHCWAGISRSTAAAFISLCVLNPDLPEPAIARHLRQISPTATPNKLLISCADQHLGRSGRMMSAIEAIGRGDMSVANKAFSTRALFDGVTP